MLRSTLNDEEPYHRPGPGGLPLALRLSEGLCVTESRAPVAGLAPGWCNGDDVNFTLVVQIHQRELERPVYDPTRPVLVRRPDLWCSCRLPLGGVDCFVVPICQPSANGDVVLDLMQKLGASVRVIPDCSHRRIKRRASAWTSSAEMSFTVPASISATRRSISRSHAASASESESPYSESNSSSARRARSWLGKVFARADSSSTRVGMVDSDCYRCSLHVLRARGVCVTHNGASPNVSPTLF